MDFFPLMRGPVSDKKRSGLVRPGLTSFGLIILAAAVLAMASLVGCGAEPPSTEVRPDVLTVEEALAADSGHPVNVRGMLVASDAGAVLASALLESYPPQAGGETIPLAGLDLSALVGVNSVDASSAGEGHGPAAISWTDHPVVLEGEVKEGVLQVGGYPQVVEASAGDVRVRFSPASAPVFVGDMVWWAFDLTNTGSAPLELVFSSGQRGEVVALQEGVEKYRWSADKAFTQAVETVRLEPGHSFGVALNDLLPLEAGKYEIAAYVTASVMAAGGQSGEGTSLPELRTVLTVW